LLAANTDRFHEGRHTTGSWHTHPYGLDVWLREPVGGIKSTGTSRQATAEMSRIRLVRHRIHHHHKQDHAGRWWPWLILQLHRAAGGTAGALQKNGQLRFLAPLRCHIKSGWLAFQYSTHSPLQQRGTTYVPAATYQQLRIRTIHYIVRSKHLH